MEFTTSGVAPFSAKIFAFFKIQSPKPAKTASFAVNVALPTDKSIPELGNLLSIISWINMH